MTDSSENLDGGVATIRRIRVGWLISIPVALLTLYFSRDFVSAGHPWAIAVGLVPFLSISGMFFYQPCPRCDRAFFRSGESARGSSLLRWGVHPRATKCQHCDLPLSSPATASGPDRDAA